MITQKVWNPNFFDDLIVYIKPDVSKTDLVNILKAINDISPTTYEKLETLVDRIEFVKHLKIVKKHAKNEKFIFQGEEINGINWDIDALRLYLSLTCIDILASNFEPFDKWLLKNCDDFESCMNLNSYIKEKSELYRESFQLSSSFSRTFMNASKSVRSDISKNVTLIKGEQPDNSLESIVSYFYRIRNKYTHEGRRFHSSLIPVDRNQNIGPRDEDQLEIKADFDLINVILLVAKEQANRIICSYAEQLNSADAKIRAAD